MPFLCAGSPEFNFACYGRANTLTKLVYLHITGMKLEVKLQPPPSDPTSRTKGTVLVRFNSTSEWGSICDDNWHAGHANVVCRMLGFE